MLHHEIHYIEAGQAAVFEHAWLISAFFCGGLKIPAQTGYGVLSKEKKEMFTPHKSQLLVDCCLEKMWKISPHWTRTNLNFLGYLLVHSSR